MNILETEKAQMAINQAAYHYMLQKHKWILDAQGRIENTSDTISSIYSAPVSSGGSTKIVVMARLCDTSFMKQCDHCFLAVTIDPSSYQCSIQEMTEDEAMQVVRQYHQVLDDDFELRRGYRPHPRNYTILQ
ncbi:hypothetical protein KSF_109860 [Reticulibacter mediterranei]|uniref:Uncharacterized protein n=1 Tax=Reticulibacter mediterranei TaxID=2778369 RepID=A0A8J3IUM0_9CHLR|nr:hypothetical protein [Reticulibacter mediterranei]GHP00939.1 hypothetical protein KSF_109860 [Reticulibacter mediterranei]